MCFFIAPDFWSPLQRTESISKKHALQAASAEAKRAKKEDNFVFKLFRRNYFATLSADADEEEGDAPPTAKAEVTRACRRLHP